MKNNKVVLFSTPSPRCLRTRPLPQGARITTHGFTLIELLIVVLIIGILAAVAVPQYQKAVYKSRYATLKNLTQSLANAEEVYYLTNGKYTKNLTDLDIDIPSPSSVDDTHTSYNDYIFDWGLCRLTTITGAQFVKCRNTSISMDYQIYFYNQYKRGTVTCVSLNDNTDSVQAQICKQETGKSTYSDSGTGWTAYDY